jgi:hypothetical protein
MRVKIGPYINRFTTNRMEDLWYRLRYKKDSRWSIEDEEMDRWDHLFEKFSDKMQVVLNATVNKIQDRRKRKVKVRVDYYDVWGADHTLGLVILPTLKLLREKKHGSPFVDAEDVPQELRPTEEAGPDNGYTDNSVHERWEWILNEMIWAFEQIVDEDHDRKFFDHSESDAAEKAGEDITESWKKIKIDKEGLDAHYSRIKRGTTFFGKYFQGLWD